MGIKHLLNPKTYCTDLEHDCSSQEHLEKKIGLTSEKHDFQKKFSFA